MSAVRMTLKMTDQFFDRPAIQRAVRRAQRDAAILRKAGAFVRRRARSSIRPVKKPTTHSPPGQPPRSHKQTEPNLRTILFAWDAIEQRMIVGPVGLYSRVAATVPEIHEKGGVVRLKVKRRRRRLRGRRNARGRFVKWKKQTEAYRRLWAEGKIDPATGQHIRRSGAKPVSTSTQTVVVRYPQRPFMQPALESELPKFPALWQGSVK